MLLLNITEKIFTISLNLRYLIGFLTLTDFDFLISFNNISYSLLYNYP